MKKICFMGIALLLFAASCNKSHTGSNVVDFPISIGTNWKYIAYDSMHNYTDTLNMAITGTTYMADGTMATIIQSYFSFSADTSYTFFVANADKATFYTSRAAADYIKAYVYPLKTGGWWLGENILDTNKVTAQGNVTVPAGSFMGYCINRNYKVTDVAVVEKEWYCTGIGMVQRNYYERNTGFIINKTFRLAAYHIGR